MRGPRTELSTTANERTSGSNSASRLPSNLKGFMISDLQIAELLVFQYNYSGEQLSTGLEESGFDYFDLGKGPHGLCWSYKVVDGITYIFLRGSVSFWDWLKDLMAAANPFDHDTLGPVHPGFEMGVERLSKDILARTKGPRVLAGHSLGAGRCRILEALLKEAGEPPLLTVCFGEPRAGFSTLAAYSADIPTRSYRNTGGNFIRQHDLVTDVPFHLPPEEYVHRCALTDISAEPDVPLRLKLSVFCYHHMPLYAQALSIP